MPQAIQDGLKPSNNDLSLQPSLPFLKNHQHHEELPSAQWKPPFDIYQLPVAQLEGSILQMARDNKCFLLEGPTGSGKTIFVGTMADRLRRENIPFGHHCSYMLSPRRAIVRQTMTTLSELAGTKVGEGFGYRIAREAVTSASTHTVGVTYGLGVRMLIHEGPKHTFYFLDEVHQRGIDTDVAMALLKKAMKKSDKIRVMLMSATPDPRVVKFFDCPVLQTQVRKHPIEMVPPQDSIAESALHLMNQKNINVMVFVYGKKKISALAAELKKLDPTCTIHIHHGEMSKLEQQKSLNSNPAPGDRNFLICTDSLGSGVTPVGYDGVVCSDLTRTSVTNRHGIEHLTLVKLDADSFKQQIGRIGRTGPGYATLHSADGASSMNDLEPSAVPEIQRASLMKVILDLYSQGEDLRELSLPARPDDLSIERDISILMQIGLLSYRKGRPELTKAGILASQLGLDRAGRMIYEAKKFEKEFPGITGDVAIIASILETSGLVDKDNLSWTTYCSSEKESDLIAQLKVFKKFSKELSLIEDPYEQAQLHKRKGVLAPMYEIARETAGGILKKLSYQKVSTEKAVDEEAYRKVLKMCIATGLSDLIYRRDRGNGWVSVKEGSAARSLHTSSCLSDRADLVVAVPLNIDYETRNGSIEAHKVLTFATELDQGFAEARGWTEMIPSSEYEPKKKSRPKSPYDNNSAKGARGAH